MPRATIHQLPARSGQEPGLPKTPDPAPTFPVSNRSAVDAATIAPGQPAARNVPWELGASGRNQKSGTAGETAPFYCADRHPIATRMIDDIERRLRDDRPVHLVIDPPTWREELADDWRGFVAEVRRSPVSHLLVALATVVGWTVLLVAPLLIGEWWS